MVNALSPQNTTVVLVRPKFSVNVGYASRAMENMGFQRLVLIDPKCQMDQRSREGAAGGWRPLQNSITYASWEAFFQAEGEGFRLGMTNRSGELKPALPLEDVFVQIDQALIREQSESEEMSLSASKKMYLIFGPEDHGLNTEDLSWAHFACVLPTYGEFSSMNLAHAVLTTLLLYQKHLRSKPTYNEGVNLTLAELKKTQDQSAMDFPIELFNGYLDALGYNFDNRRRHAGRKLANVILRAIPSPAELRIMHDVFGQSMRKLREYNEMRKSTKNEI